MSKITLLLCFLALAAVCMISTQRALALDEPVRVESGLLSGADSADPDVRVFKGVPFAAPPVGALRWRPPQPVKAWTGTRAATEFGPACPQPPDPILRFLGLKMGPTSEDCLYLNVWTPAKKASDKLPVMVWIHGGAFMNGSGSLAFYDGTELAKQGVVVVTINYRLGPFGFFAHPLLSKESPHNVSGNYGMLDQIAALHWVKKNIPAFGGDAERVTIFGESAGSMSVCCLLASPLAKGLFQRAIAESGTPFNGNRHLRQTWYGQEPMEKVGERIAHEIVGDQEKDVLAALRAKSADEILKGSNLTTDLLTGTGNRFGPVTDGWVLPDDPGVIFASGKQQAVPLLVGSNEDEGTIFTLLLPDIDAAQFRAIAERLYGADADAVLKFFPATTSADARRSVNRLLADGYFLAGARYAAQMQSKANKAYFYHFTYVSSTPRFAALGAFHGSEIAHIFGGLHTAQNADESGKRLTQTMMGAWARFAATGDPNGNGMPEWPRYDDASDRYMEFGKEVVVKSGLRKDEVDLLEKIAAKRRANRAEKAEAP